MPPKKKMAKTEKPPAQVKPEPCPNVKPPEPPPKLAAKDEPTGKNRFVYHCLINVTQFENYKFNEKMYGPEFVTSDNNVDLHWQFYILPSGSAPTLDKKYEDQIGWFLGYKQGPWKHVVVDKQCYIESWTGTAEYRTEYKNCRQLISENFGEPEWIPHDSLNKLKDTSLRNKRFLKVVLILSIPKEYFEPVEAVRVKHEAQLQPADSREPKESNEQNLTPAKKSLVSFEPYFDEVILKDGKQCADSDSDFVVIAGEAKKMFHCHKIVFRAKIREFMRKIENAPGHEWCLELKTHQAEVVQEMLSFMYRGTVSEDFKEYPKLIRLAMDLNFPELKEHSEKKLIDTLSGSNVEKFSDFSVELHLAKLQLACQTFMVQDVSELTAIRYFKLAKGKGWTVVQDCCLSFMADHTVNLPLSDKQEAAVEMLKNRGDVMQKKRLCPIVSAFTIRKEWDK